MWLGWCLGVCSGGKVVVVVAMGQINISFKRSLCVFT